MRYMGYMGCKELFGIHLEDAREISRIIPKNCVDVTITSPPYGNLKNYEKGIPEEFCSKQIGFKQSYEEYLDDLQMIFKSIFYVTKSTGSLWVVVNTFKDKEKLRLLPFDLIKRLEEVGWKLQDIVIWNKVTKSLPWSNRGRFRNIFEYILFFTKGERFKYYVDRIRELDLKDWWIKYPERYNPKGKVPPDIWDFQIPTQGKWSNGYLRHFCPFPKDLIERIILLTTNKNDAVLDPFAGSGMVLAVAKCMKRRYIGFEINKEYVEKFEKNVLPQMEKELKNILSEENRFYQKQVKISNEIKKLRCLKYPKILVEELFKLYKQNDLGRFSINTIFAITRKNVNSRSSHKSKILKEDIYLIFDKNKDGDIEFLSPVITGLKNRAPLSGFGIDANISILNKKEFIKRREENNIPPNLYLYPRGITHYTSRRISFNDWIKESESEHWKLNHQNHIPPILSNIMIRNSNSIS